MPVRTVRTRFIVWGVVLVACLALSVAYTRSSSASPRARSAAEQGCSNVSDQAEIDAEYESYLDGTMDSSERYQYEQDHGLLDVSCGQSPSRDRSARAAAGSFSQSVTGTFAFPAPRGRGSARLSEFRRGRLAAGFVQSSYVGSARSEDTRFSGTVVLKFSARGAGSACVSFSGMTVSHQQEASGHFVFLGGTGAAARLHATGIFAAVQPMPYSTKWIADIAFNSSIGSRRSLPARCGKPPPVHTGHVTASFLGFAKTVGPPSTSATLTANGGTISGPNCHAGGSLYGIFQYAGPSQAEWQTGMFGPSNAIQSRTAAVRPGRNVLLLFKGPPNGSYSSKIYIQATGSEQLTGATFFGPSITINC